IETHLANAGSAKRAHARPVPAPRQRYRRTPNLTTFYGSVESTRPRRPTDLALEVPFRYAPDPARLPERVAVIAHVYYPDLCDEIRDYLANIPVRADLFVSTDTEAKRAAIAAAFAGHSGSVSVEVFPNVGRDVAPMLVGFARVFEAYPVFLHIHSKKSPHEGRLAPWRRYLLDTLLGSPEIVRSILGLLSNSNVGLVYPEHFEPVRSLLNWGSNYDAARSLLGRAGIGLSKELVLEFPSSSFYWGRSDALRGLLDQGLDWGDFPAEAGQVDGTTAHAIERAILYFVEGRGYRWAKVGRADRVPPETLVPALAERDLPQDLLRVCRSLLHNRLPALESRPLFGDLTPIATRPDGRTRPRLNLIIPTLKPELRFGGITTAIRIFEEIAEALGGSVDLRIICQTRALDLESMLAFPGYRLVGFGACTDFPRVVVDVTDQESGELDVRPGDVFVATAWWTAVNAYELQARQAAYFGIGRKVVYLIQDHEPDFYGWSPQYGMAQATYGHGDRTIALINSEELAAFMARAYAVPDAYVVRFKLNPAIGRAMSRRPRERIILLYGRPNTPRNCFSTICAAVSRWQQANPTAAALWRVVSAGESYAPAAAGAVQNLDIHGKLSLEDYADLLSRASVGISLMLSPHPSYPPLEMAQGGLHTITNAYDGKDLSKRNPRILSIPFATPEAVLEALETAIVRAEAEIGRIVEISPIAELPCAVPDFEAATLAGRIREEIGSRAGDAAERGGADR
ncbi:rhamnan synthesis F family protein, partial [Methylobacterium trifolii]